MIIDCAAFREILVPACKRKFGYAQQEGMPNKKRREKKESQTLLSGGVDLHMPGAVKP
jgi:hypothetical protein